MDLLRSLPLGLYLEQPVTWLHRLDPRVKLGWLMLFLLSPILASPLWRIGLVVALLFLTFSARIPLRVWRQQMGWLLMLAGLLFVLTAVLPDGQLLTQQSYRPNSGLTLPPASDYRFDLWSWGNLRVTQRSLNLAIRTSTLIFTLLYSTTLYLLTTTPEEITAAIEDCLAPLRRWGIPVTEISLALTLGLRFLPLVLEEIQSLYRSVTTRAIDWKQLGWRRGLQIWLLVAERVLQNLLLRAEQIAASMQVRGFTSPSRHRVPWHDLQLQRRDRWAIAIGIGAVGVRCLWGQGSL
ncbi:CbiQ family ECF transporter T component [Synechococcus elongatus]|uniref:CbiQ family ECF transporter T component n=1 Tax=Synechococcus elongatus PCC 11802 TaxID=2283154 RepID=A0AAT9JXZ3_SYNEL|nr:CbiQ family ECF transporter T component [Synechococcus elongatus]QFZ91875.1 hypothetical protein EKO22_05280 [Synechococcus elongatus PCC 11802]